MTHPRLQGLLTLSVWSVAALGFAITVFSKGGPVTYADDAQRRLIGGIFLAVGIFGAPLLRFLARRRGDPHRVDRDERDKSIEAKATRIGLTTVVTLVFLGAIALWDAYQEPGCVPVGWMWVLAYATLILSYVVPTAVGLVLDWRGTLRAED